jgi:16S rRNA (guanine527-N7)-methyltransferase
MDELLARGIDALLEQDRRLHAFFSEQERSRLQETLEAYVRELELFNPAYGLVGTESHEELIIKHILDSLAPLGPILRALDRDGSAPPSLSIADAGTGAGLPGLPLACALSSFQFTLIERMGRRIGFLQNTLAVLGLKNVRLEQADIEKARSGPFDLITFRAFRPLEPPILKALLKLLKPGGVLGAYKGRLEKIREEMAPIESLIGSWEAIPVHVPFLNEERHLVVIRP